MLRVLCLKMHFVLTLGVLVVDRAKEGLTSVPRNISAGATTLYLDSNSISRLQNNSFDYLVSLEKLYIRNNGITYIAMHALEENIRLYLLYIGGHKLPVLPTHLGGASGRIRQLDTRGVIYMKSMQLANFQHLAIIAMNDNRLLNGNLILKHLPNLKLLFAPRCNLHVFPNLSAAPALEKVQLHFNKFSVIPASTLRNVSRLHTLGLIQSRIRYLPDMSRLVSLKHLFITGNTLMAIPDLFDLPLANLLWTSNPLECNESLCWARMWNDVKPTVLQQTPVTCASPPEVIGIHLTDIHPVVMKCYTGDF